MSKDQKTAKKNAKDSRAAQKERDSIRWHN